MSISSNPTHLNLSYQNTIGSMSEMLKIIESNDSKDLLNIFKRIILSQDINSKEINSFKKVFKNQEILHYLELFVKNEAKERNLSLKNNITLPNIPSYTHEISNRKLTSSNVLSPTK
jgi:hypothetical protein